MYYDQKKVWTQSGDPIDSDDFNSWLWISKDDFEKLKTNYYGRISRQCVLSGLTVPFKYRPKVGGQPSSVISGDRNLGSFIGFRFVRGDKGGLTLGGTLGLTSLAHNASNNTALTEKKTETTAGFNYGGALVYDWKKKFQIGLVWAYDYGVGNLSKTYVYQDRKWRSLSLNYLFLDFGKVKDENKPEAKDKK